MPPVVRREQIMAELARRRYMSVHEIIDRFSSSFTTTRRDLDALVAEGRARRTHGGVVALDGAGPDGAAPAPSDVARHEPFAAEKRRIAAAAAALIADGDTVGLSGGSTCQAIARALSGRQLGVITNAADVALDLIANPGVRVMLIGGMLNPSSRELVGPMAEAFLDQVHIATLFLGVDGISAEAGATCNGDLEAQIVRAMAARTQRVVVVADHRKIGRVALTRMLPLADMEILITDAHPSPALAAIGETGVRVIAV